MYNAHVSEQSDEYDNAEQAAVNENVNATTAPIGACSNGLLGSGRSVLTSYVVPPETWLAFTTAERRQNWITPRIPPNVSLDCWTKWSTPRLAYVREYNWEKRGARGLFEIDHYGVGNFNTRFVIGSPISPSLYTYVNQTLGESGAKFAILSRNATWMSAAIGGFDPMPITSDEQDADGVFWVHYNDTGGEYSRIRLPYRAFANYMRELVPADLRQASWPQDDSSAPAPESLLLGESTPLVTGTAQSRAAPGTDVPAMPAPLTNPSDATPGTTVDAKLINETFWSVDLSRFWPQFMTALDIALYSPVGSKDLMAVLSRKEHWFAIEKYMAKHRGAYRWVPPKYASGSQFGSSDVKPRYLLP